MYIASYVLKAEKGMGELLKQAAKELQQGNTRQQLNKLGSVFLTNREVSGLGSSVQNLIDASKQMQQNYNISQH